MMLEAVCSPPAMVALFLIGAVALGAWEEWMKNRTPRGGK